jgi:hypothetical protein
MKIFPKNRKGADRIKNHGFFTRNFFPKSRKGFLLGEETLKIVVALICIVVLIYFLAMLYYAKVDSAKLAQAKALLIDSSESIKARINNLDSINPVEQHLINPKGWYLFSFANGGEKPNYCAGLNCLCICDKLSRVNFWKSQIEECGEDGVCLIEENLQKFNEIKIDQQFIIIRKVNNNIIIREK